MYKAVFSDIDGTLLNSAHQVTPRTRDAILALDGKGIPFTLVSARSPAAIEPIRRKNGFSGPLICFSGALILDRDGNVLHSQGMDLAQAREIIEFAEENRFDMAWSLYSAADWLVRDRSDPKVAMEEAIVELQAQNLPLGQWPREQTFYKILCICNPAASPEIERRMKARFPRLSDKVRLAQGHLYGRLEGLGFDVRLREAAENLTVDIVRSSEMMLEIMVGGVSKGFAVRRLCSHLGIDPREAIALGDNYNDLDMLNAVGRPVVMQNAPEDIRRRFDFITDDNDHDGVARAIRQLI